MSSLSTLDQSAKQEPLQMLYFPTGLNITLLLWLNKLVLILDVGHQEGLEPGLTCKDKYIRLLTKSIFYQ